MGSLKSLFALLFCAFALFAARPAFADQIICTSDGSGVDTCEIVQPNVLKPMTTYPTIMLHQNDQILSIEADGCVQTGGTGATWKRYLDPDARTGSSPAVRYYGTIQIPGQPVRRIVDVQRLISALPVADGPLGLGYEDDGYSDNGYYSHDSGTGGQCADVYGSNHGRATVKIVIKRGSVPFAAAGTIFGQCTPQGTNQAACHVDRPDVTQASENYPSVIFAPGDQVQVAAGGCVQTGGAGKTWKRYVDPDRNTSDPNHAYSGEIAIPGATPGLVRISSILGKTLTSTGGVLQLGYLDKGGLGDNGYWSHDDGTDGQCHGEVEAHLDLTITHAAMPASAHITFDGMEVTQAIQDMSLSVPLVAAKPTFVRVYVSGTVAGVSSINGLLRVTRNGAMVATLGPQKPLALGIASLHARREDLNGALEYQLPAIATAAGPTTLSLIDVTDAATGKPIDCHLCTATVATFVSGPPLRLRVIGVTYIDPATTATLAPADADYNMLASWLGRAYPVPSVQWTRAEVTGDFAPPFKNDINHEMTCDHVNSFVGAIRAKDISNGADARTHYFGLVASTSANFYRGCSAVPTSPQPKSVASGPAGKNAFGDTDGSYADWYGGHELGHSFGRKHPGICGETKDDPSYPYSDGFISDVAGTFEGWDMGDSRVDLDGSVITPPTVGNPIPLQIIPGHVGTEIMTYCNLPQWLSAYTYKGVLAQVTAEDQKFGPLHEKSRASDQRGMKAGDFVHVSGLVDLSAGTGSIEAVFPVTRAEAPVDALADVQLIAFDPSGQEIQRFAVDATPISDHGPDRIVALISAEIPALPTMSRIDLAVRGRTAATFKSGLTAPSAPERPRLTSLSFGLAERKIEPRVRLSWAASHALSDGDVRYIIEVQSEGLWQTVAINLSNPTTILPLREIIGRPLRITATNGLKNSASVFVPPIGATRPLH